MRKTGIGCRALFILFSRMALLGFGGVLPFAYRYLVERARWLTAEEFGELLSIAQVLPGPTVCNLSVMVGQRFAGTRGAVAALGGMLAGPFLIVIALGMAYQQLASAPLFNAAMRGMAAAAAGLILATAAKLAQGMWRASSARRDGRRWAQLVLLVLAFLGLGVFKAGLVTVVCVLGPLGVLLFALAWRQP